MTRRSRPKHEGTAREDRGSAGGRSAAEASNGFDLEVWQPVIKESRLPDLGPPDP